MKSPATFVVAPAWKQMTHSDAALPGPRPLLPFSIAHGLEELNRRPAGHAEKQGWSQLLPAGLLLMVGTITIGAAGLKPTPGGSFYAIVAPPWFGLAATVGLASRAGAEIVDTGGVANVVIVHSTRPDQIAALYQAGAWMVIDAVHLQGCLGLRPDQNPAKGART